MFIALRVFANNLFFSTIQNGYESGFGISDENFKMDIVLFMVYAIIYYLVYVIIAFWILPILYPLFMTKEMDTVVRKTYFYILILLLGTIITIVYTISIHEDIGKALIRVHTRYFNSIIGVILPVFGASISYPLENKKEIRYG